MKHCLWLFLLLNCFLFVACISDEELSSTSAQSGFIISLGDEVDAGSRAIPSELDKPIAKNFNVFIQSDSSKFIVYDGGYTDRLITASSGTYVLTASYGENPQIAYDTPYYAGKVYYTLAADEQAEVTIPCHVANALVSVSFTNPELFNNVYRSYGLRVAVGNYSLVLNADNLDKSVYFPANRQDVKFFSECVSKDGVEAKFDITDELAEYLPLQAGDHAKIKLTATNFGMTLDKIEVEHVTVTQTIPLEWLPAPRTTGFDTITYTETDDAPETAQLSYSALRDIDDMSLTFNFEDEQYKSYNKEYLLSTLTDDEEQDLLTIGIDMKTLSQTKKGSFDVSDLISKLQTNAGTTTHNTISFKLHANERWSNTTVCNIDVKKPEFAVQVYPGNIWTKEFTATELQKDDVATGNFDTLKAQLRYQYSTDGSHWSDLPTDLRVAQLSPDTKVYVRALYRDVVPSEVTEFNTCPLTAVPYGDMESWREYSRKNVVKGANVFTSRVTVTGHYPNNDVWSCVNQKTLEGSPNILSTYNVNQSTYRETGRTGYAAALKTVGWDNSSGNTTSIIYHKAAGKLFIGSYSYNHSSNTDNYDFGMAYVSRPTQMQFYCKYTPYKTDSFKAIVVLENRTNGVTTRVGYGECTSNESLSSFKEMNVDINYDDTYKKLPITHMYILFSSSANYSDVESTETDNLSGMVSNGDYHNGSILIVDDVSLIYGK
jgi:hypothetical protein